MPLSLRRRVARLAAAGALLLILGASGLWVAARLTPLESFWPEGRDARPTLRPVYDRRGELIALHRDVPEAFTPVSLPRTDPWLVRATLAAEDRRFRLHPGVDPLAVLRAAWANARAGRVISGGSTITQQLVKAIEIDQSRRMPAPDAAGETRRRAILDQSRDSFSGKLRQAWHALVLEAHLSKDEILEHYLNRVWYGSTERGAGAASWILFGHDCRRLRLEEAALPQSPVRHDPWRHPQRAKAARDRVLRRLGLDEESLREALDRPLLPPALSAGEASARVPYSGGSIAPHWIRHAASRDTTTPSIRLPLDCRVQEAAAGALRATVDALRVRGADAGGICVIHNATGEVRAWVGSPDWYHPQHGEVDGVLALRQPGSALKPFTYALAFDHGATPASLLPDLPLAYAAGRGVFRPRNYSHAYHGPVRAREALANSWNAPAVHLLSRLGVAPLLDLLLRAGLTSLDRPAESYGLGLTLGVGEVSLRQLTNAYAALARGGLFREAIESLPGATTDASRVVSARSAFWVNSILSDPAARAPAFGLGGIVDFPFPVALKTGTSSDWRDNWAFGYTPVYTVGVWIGSASGASMDQVSGTHGALLALRSVLLHLHDEQAAVHAEDLAFAAPAGTHLAPVCALSGMPCSEACPERILEWLPVADPERATENGAGAGWEFARAPVCSWHRMVTIEFETGLLARACTPGSARREILVAFPPSAGAEWAGPAFLGWAIDQGWPEPPQEAAMCTCARADCEILTPPAPAEAADALLADADTARRHWRGLSARRGAVSSASEAGGDGGRTGHPSAPPDRVSCRITRPLDGSVYAIDPTLPRSQQQLTLEARAGDRRVRWTVNDFCVGETEPGRRAFLPLEPGRLRIRAEALPSPGETAPEPASTADDRSDAVTVFVESAWSDQQDPR